MADRLGLPNVPVVRQWTTIQFQGVSKSMRRIRNREDLFPAISPTRKRRGGIISPILGAVYRRLCRSNLLASGGYSGVRLVGISFDATSIYRRITISINDGHGFGPATLSTMGRILF